MIDTLFFISYRVISSMLYYFVFHSIHLHIIHMCAYVTYEHVRMFVCVEGGKSILSDAQAMEYVARRLLD